VVNSQADDGEDNEEGFKQVEEVGDAQRKA
jgi:hypothetical protein